MAVFNLVPVVGCLNCFYFCHLSYGCATEYGINIPFPLIGSDVKTNDATHAPRDCGNIYFLHHEAFWGEQSEHSSWSIWFE